MEKKIFFEVSTETDEAVDLRYKGEPLEIAQAIMNLMLENPNVYTIIKGALAGADFHSNRQPEFKIIEKFNTEVLKWGNDTFGIDRNPTEPLYHMKEEIDEAIEALTIWNVNRNEENLQKVKFEFADLFILLNHSASLFQFPFKQLFQSSSEKFEIVKKRVYGKPDKNGVCKHIKESECVLKSCFYPKDSLMYKVCDGCINYAEIDESKKVKKEQPCSLPECAYEATEMKGVIPCHSCVNNRPK